MRYDSVTPALALVANGVDVLKISNLTLQIVNAGAGANPILFSNSASQELALTGILNLQTSKGINFGEPTNATDAATKNYVDTHVVNGIWTKSGSHIFPTTLSDSVCIGTNTQNSPLHVFEDTSNVGATAGVTIQQAGTGDAIVQYLLAGGQRWVSGIDNSDGDKYKIASSPDLGSDARLTIDPTTGNVGFGTDTPLEPISLVGNFSLTPKNPTLAGSLLDSITMDDARRVRVIRDYAYVVAQDSDSLAIINISDKTNPTLVGSLIDAVNLNGPVSIFVAGKYAYIANDIGDSFAIVDISDPSTPTFVSSIVDGTNLNQANDVYVAGRYAYVTASISHSLSVIDISDPTNPTVTGRLIDPTNMNRPSAVHVVGRYAYVTGEVGDSLAIIDISDPSNPTFVSVVVDAVNMDGPRGLFVSGNFAYVAGFTSDSLAIVDISDPSTPTVAGSVSSGSQLDGSAGVFVSGKYAYVTGDDGISIIDVSDSTTPIIIGFLSDVTNMADATGVYVSGKFAYVASRTSDSLSIINISGIDAPTASIGNIEVGSLNVKDNIVIGNDLYAGRLNVGNDALIGGNLTVTGTIDSDALNVLGSINVNESVKFVDDTMQPQAAISDYITGNAATLRFTGKSFDYSTESNDAQAMAMTKDGKRIFLTGLINPAAPTNDTIIQYDLTTPFDISTATNPVIESTGGNATSIRQITLSPDEKKIYVGSFVLNRIVAFDLTTPRDITTLTYNDEFVATTGTGTIAHYISPDGLRLYVGDSTGDVVTEYFMTEAGNLLTATPTGATVSTGAETVVRGVTFSPTGRRMYISGSATDSVIELEMATPWDIVNAVIVNTIPLTAQNNFVNSVFFRDDMQKMYLVGFTPKSIHEYDMERPSKVATSTIEVFSAADLPAPVSGTITLPTGNYILHRSLELTDDLEIATNATVTIQSADRLLNTLSFNQGGTFITAPSLGATNILSIKDITILLGGANAQLFDTTGGNLIFNDTTVIFTGTGTKTIGSSATLGNGFIGGSILQGYNAGWSITSVAQFAILSSNLISDGTGSGPTINIDALTVLATMNNIGVTVTGSESVFDFVNTITAPIVIDGVTKTGTGNFYTSGALNQTNVNVNTTASPGSPDSQIVGGFFTGTVQDITGITASFADLTFTNTPVALDIQERYEVTFAATVFSPEMEATFLEDTDVRITWPIPIDANGDSTVGTFEFKFVIDEGAGFIDIPQSPVVKLSIKDSDDAFTATYIATIRGKLGQKIKPQIVRTAGSRTFLQIDPSRCEITRVG